MTRLPRAAGREMVAGPIRGGFALSHVRGSHRFRRKPGAGFLVAVLVHGGRTLPLGTRRSVLRQVRLTPQGLVLLLSR